MAMSDSFYNRLDEMAEVQETWLPIIGRALAYLCMRANPGDETQSLQQKARLLEGLGLSRTDAASILGTTAASITELHRQAKAKKPKRGSRGSAKRTAARSR